MGASAPAQVPGLEPNKVPNSVNSVHTSRTVHALLDTHSRTADGESFFVANLAEVEDQFHRWNREMPGIEPFFAIKCNPDPHVIGMLAKLGAGFDCASQQEISAVLEHHVPADKIIYANPTKQPSMITYAKSVGVTKMTFDNADELHKISTHFPDAECVLRILVDDSKSACRFGTKFGASLQNVSSLLQLCQDLRLNLIGVSFHVGSGCTDADSFRQAVVDARKVFDMATEMGIKMTLLDLGGGYPGFKPGHGQPNFSEIAQVLSTEVKRNFPSGVRVIAEPGRYFVSTAYTLAVNITSRRITETSGERNIMYYVNDGVYGSFNCIIFDHATVTPKILRRANQFHYENESENHKDPRFITSIWGPTCDSMDCITKSALMPELEIGDWIYFENMGAYTNAAASTFNGFKKSLIFYTNSHENNLNRGNAL